MPSGPRPSLALWIAALAAVLALGVAGIVGMAGMAGMAAAGGARPPLLGAAVAAATLAGFLAGRRLARPIGELSRGAARLARGDLETPVAGSPPGPWSEAASLAASMEDMRRRLRGLTEAVHRRQGEAEAVLSGISEGVFAVDRDRTIRYLNPQAAALLGLDPAAAAAAVGRFCGDVLKPRGADGARPCDEACPIVHARFRGGARATEHLVAASGARRAVVVTSSPPGGAVGAQLVRSAADRQFQVLRDETEVESARRLRDAVLANISHEFKTPLAAQLASIELLAERLAEIDAAGGIAGAAGSGTRELVRSLERGTLRLTQLIDNLLESVRIEAGEVGIRRRAVALDEVVEQAVEMTAPLVAQRLQRLEVDLPFPLPAVAGDAPRLTQVLVNLLANANKFAPEASTIRVGGAVEGAEIVLWVEDEGAGLPEDPEASLFERFVRSPRALDGEPEPSGVGLGLWIVKSIVERHGGRIDMLPARRPEPGSTGTRVRIALPRADGGAAA